MTQRSQYCPGLGHDSGTVAPTGPVRVTRPLAGRVTRGLVIAVALLGAGCKEAPPPADAPPPAPDATPAAKIKITRMSGRAENAKLSAIVVGDLGVVYCLDRPAWPESVLGTTVTVEGELETTVEFNARMVPGSAISQGTGGPDLVFRKTKLVEQ